MDKTTYQKKTVKKALKAFETASRGRICWPCGAGKTRLGKLVSDNYDTVLVMVPSLSLVEQWIKNEFTEGVVLCVCSDSQLKEKETVELSVQVTTNPEDVNEFMKQPGRKVVFATYQSSKALSKGCRRLKFDLGVFDEAHRTAGMAKTYGMTLYDKNVRIGKRLFLTATERMYNGKKDNVLSMCNAKVYGESIDFVSFKQAIEWGWLCDYQVASPVVTSSQVLSIDGDEEAIVKAGGMLAKRVMDDKGLKKGVAFWSTRMKSRQFTKLTNRIGIKAFHIDGTMSSDERSVIMAAFEAAPRAILSNVKVLSEGVDVPAIDMVMFGDPKNSTVEVVQASGRAMRLDKKNKKKLACICIPILVEDDDDAEVAGNKQFETAMSIIDSLGAMDSRLIDWISGFVRIGGGGIDYPPVNDISPIEFIGDVSELIKMRYFDRIRWLAPYLPVEEFMKQLKASGITCNVAYIKEWKKHLGWPSNPTTTYGLTWRELLGRPRRARPAWAVTDPLPVEEFMKQLKASGITVLKSRTNVNAYMMQYANHPGWPRHPRATYGMTWRALLGLSDIVRVNYKCRPTTEEFLRQLGASGITKTRTYELEYRNHPGWPPHPKKTYKISTWREIVARSRNRSVWDNLPVEEFMKQLKASGIVKMAEYLAKCDEHLGWPRCPMQVYGMTWNQLLGRPKREVGGRPKGWKRVAA